MVLSVLTCDKPARLPAGSNNTGVSIDLGSLFGVPYDRIAEYWGPPFAQTLHSGPLLCLGANAVAQLDNKLVTGISNLHSWVPLLPLLSIPK